MVRRLVYWQVERVPVPGGAPAYMCEGGGGCLRTIDLHVNEKLSRVCSILLLEVIKIQCCF